HFLLRNNSGCFYDRRGVLIRFGLGNESSKSNLISKSPDLIGGRELIITQEMVGKKILQFLAREVKKPGWVYKGTPREVAQKNFIDDINSRGGDAMFVTDVGSI